MTLEWAGIKSHLVRTTNGAFAGVIAWNPKSDTYTVGFNMTCTKRSARKFPSVEAAVEYIRERRIRKGWRV